MASTQNQGSLQTGQPKFSVYMNSDKIKALVSQAVGENAQRFTASIISAVSNNPTLNTCEQGTILSAALLGESLKLSPSPQLGQFYMIPFKDKDRGMVAQFVIGYKGYIQLAIRSGVYRKLVVLAIKKGEVIKYDPLTEELYVNLIQDEETRENAETVGYYAMFEYINGFRKSIYWTKTKMKLHAEKYSKGYAAHKGYTFWEKDFDSMALKTMIRQLISKWGVMSVDMEKAFSADENIVDGYNRDDLVSTEPDYDLQADPETGEISATTEAEEDFDFFDSHD